MRKTFIIIAFAIATGFTTVSAAVHSVETDIFQEKQYKKIEVSAIDKAAMDKIKKSYGAYTVKEAYKADDGEYKLVLSKDGIDTTATFTPAGDLIKILS